MPKPSESYCADTIECFACDGTGSPDYAGFAMDRCTVCDATGRLPIPEPAPSPQQKDYRSTARELVERFDASLLALQEKKPGASIAAAFTCAEAVIEHMRALSSTETGGEADPKALPKWVYTSACAKFDGDSNRVRAWDGSVHAGWEDSPEFETAEAFYAWAKAECDRRNSIIATLATHPAPSETGASVGTVREALEWYAEQVAGCRKLSRIGDPYRQALDKDGGKRASVALAALEGRSDG